MIQPSQLLNKLNDFKEKGNSHFKSQSFSQAINEFNNGINLIKENIEVYQLQKSMFKEVFTALYTNKCLANSKMNDKDDEIIEDTNYVLTSIDEKNLKALFRRAVAYKNKKRFKESIKDLQVVIDMDANNKNAKDELVIVKKMFDEDL
jgi:tetratricopeptide (TPR) repeat protein